MTQEQNAPTVTESLAIVGSGAIACGLAATAARHGHVQLLARSEASATRAQETLQKLCARMDDDFDHTRLEIVTDAQALCKATFVVEAVIEDHDVKVAVLSEMVDITAPQTVLATTTSSLSIERLAGECGRPDCFVGLHVFNPVTKMKLVELVFPGGATQETRTRAVQLCETLEKTVVEIPDVPGFVVNRLLFPYLFNAVRLLEETGLKPADVDTCMKLGAGHPMGPLALLDLVGLDVSKAIGETIGETIPQRLDDLVNRGALGRKTGAGFHSY